MLKCSGGHEDFIESDIASCTASVVGRACVLPQASSRFYPLALLVIQALGIGCLHLEQPTHLVVLGVLVCV